MNNQLIPIIDNETKKQMFQQALFFFTNKDAFLGSMLQCITTKYTYQIPTAAIGYNPKTGVFELLLNPVFFCYEDFETQTKRRVEERQAILQHEILHFTNKHLFRLPWIDVSSEERQIYNVAGDMAINQFIMDLPKGAINVREWKLNNGEMFPIFKTMEEYYQLIKDNMKANEEKFKGSQTLDDHSIWEQLTEEQKKELLQEAKNLVQRTIEKTSYSYSKIPDFVQDFLQEIEKMSYSLDYKAILRSAIKRSVSASDRESTWKRPNKRYNTYAPGTRVGNLPFLFVNIDTSGSISIEEYNNALRILDNFLHTGARSCKLGLWHTNLYYNKKYKLGQKLNNDDIQSGGTDVACVLEYVKKNNPDLTIILTDGYYDDVNINLTNDIIWIIFERGNQNHPLKRFGKTILLEGLK